MGRMVEVVIDSLRVSLTNQQRVVILHEQDTDNYLPIWIGPYEAEAITIALQEVEVSRPLTHDLLKNVFTKLNARLVRIEVSSLKEDVFYGHIICEVNGESMEIDSRPSDALALAVRAHIPIFVDSDVLKRAGIQADQSVQPETGQLEGEEPPAFPEGKVEPGNLSLFSNFIDQLDIGDESSDEEGKKGDQTPE
jgi:bifunctional DNase/RNase